MTHIEPPYPDVMKRDGATYKVGDILTGEVKRPLRQPTFQPTAYLRYNITWQLEQRWDCPHSGKFEWRLIPRQE